MTANPSCSLPPRASWFVLLLVGLLFGGCQDSASTPAPLPPDVHDEPSADVVEEPEPSNGSEDTPCAPDPEGRSTFAIGDWRIEVDRGTGAYSILRPGDRLEVLSAPSLCGPEAAPLMAATGRPRVDAGAGQFRVDLNRGNILWVSSSMDAPPEVSSTPQRLELRLPLEETEEGPSGRVLLRFQGFDGDALSVTLHAEDSTVQGGGFSWSCQEDEAFFGLGTQVTGLDLRGRTFPLITQEQGLGKPERGGVFPIQNFPEAAYAPVGALHSSAGWSWLVTHDAFSEVDLCRGHEDRFTIRSWTELPGVVFLPGASPRDRLAAMSIYLGRPSPVPDWVFGPWNDAVGGPTEVRDLAERLRSARIPSSAIWTEDWIGGELTANGFRLTYRWSWDEETYPDLPEMIRELQAQGFAFLAYFNPFIPDTVPTWPEAVERGFLVVNQRGEPYTSPDPAFRTAGLVDLLQPEAREWVQSFLRTAIVDLGIDGWMADFAEWYPLDAQTSDGSNPWAAHNRYPLLWQQTHREVFEEVSTNREGLDRGWTFFSRSGWGSIHGGFGRLAPVLWGGDQNTDWGMDDGLPTVIPIGVHAGLSGATLYGSDIAGYTTLGRIPPSTKELFLRWTTVGALSPVMRTHHGSQKCENWRFYRDNGTLAHWIRWSRVHASLLPWFQRLHLEAQEQGLPLMRHPWLVEPDARGLWLGRGGYQYFLGDDILVAPVLEEGSTSREVVLPGQGWWPLFGMAPLQSETPEPELGTWSLPTFPVPLTDAAIFVRPGTALPLLPWMVDTFYGPVEAPLTSLEDIGHDVRFALYPDDRGLVSGHHNGVSIEVSFAVDSNFLGATVAGTPLPTCTGRIGDRTPTFSGPGCVSESGRWMLLRGSGTFGVDGARVVVDASADEVLVRLGLGGGAWGSMAVGVDPGDLNPDPESLTPICPPETQDP